MIVAKNSLLVLGVAVAGATLAIAILTDSAAWLLLVPSLALLIWALASPYRCLLLVLFAFPLERIGAIPTPWFNIKPFQLLAILMLFALLIRSARGRTAVSRFPRSPLLAWYLAFLVANMISFAFSSNPDDMRAIFHYLMFALIAVLVVMLVRTREQLSGALRVLALSGAVAGVFGLLQYFGYLAGLDTAVQETRMIFTTGEAAALRVTSFYFDANLFASFLCLTLPLGLAAGQAARNALERVLAAVGVLAMLVALAFTQSRSGFFGVEAGCVAFLLAQRRWQASARAFFVAVLIFAAAWATLNFIGAEWYSPDIVLSRALAVEEGVTERSHAWKQILEAFYDHPVLGVGPAQAANWGAYIPNLRSNWDIYNSRIVAHNVFVDVAVGAGLLGLVPFAFLVALLVWRAWCNARSSGATEWEAGIFAALVAVLVNSLSMTTLMYPFLWTLVGFVVASAEFQRAPAPTWSGLSAEPPHQAAQVVEVRP